MMGKQLTKWYPPTDHEIFDKYITKKQLAEHFSCSLSTINKWMRQGIPYYKDSKMVRFDTRETRLWFQKRKAQQ